LQQTMYNGFFQVTFGPLFYEANSSGDTTFFAWDFDNGGPMVAYALFNLTANPLL